MEFSVNLKEKSRVGRRNGGEEHVQGRKQVIRTEMIGTGILGVDSSKSKQPTKRAQLIVGKRERSSWSLGKRDYSP